MSNETDRLIQVMARLRDPQHAHGICHRMGAVYEGDIQQRDTYFRVREGRLKLPCAF